MRKKFFIVTLLVATHFVSFSSALRADVVNPGFRADLSSDLSTAIGHVNVLSNGRLLVSGFFENVNGERRPRNAILTAESELNPEFLSLTSSFVAGPAGISSSLELADGKILVGGNFDSVNGVARSYLARVNPDGTLDDTFNCGFQLRSDYHVAQIIMLPQEKLLIVGSLPWGRMARINSDCSRDTTFGVNGNFLVSPRVTLLDDGKIIAAGRFNQGTSDTTRDLTRLNENGTVDETFARLFADSSVYDLSIQPDGKIVIVGNFGRLNNINHDRVARVNPDGTIDPSLVASVTRDCCGSSTVRSILLQSDGKFVIGGSFDRLNGILSPNIGRLNSDGSTDLQFDVGTGTDRPVGLNGFDRGVWGVVGLADGSILINGYFNRYNDNLRSGIAILDSMGELATGFDPTFGNDSSASVLKAKPDGKILIAGDFAMINGIRKRGIARIDLTGVPDPEFNPDYTIVDHVNHFELLSDGKILVSGFFRISPTSTRYLVRLNADGSLDNTFNVVLNSGVSSTFQQSDGKILIGGHFSNVNGVTRFGFARLNANGTLDASLPSVSFFDPSGALLNKIAVQPDGKIIVAGRFETVQSISRVGIVRLNLDGSVDSTFSPIFDVASGPDRVLDFVLLTNGKLILVGALGRYPNQRPRYILKLNSDGTIDSTFDASDYSGFVPNKLELRNNGKILVASGAFGVPFGLFLLNSNGTTDRTLNVGSGADRDVLAIASTGSSEVIIVGRFTRFANSVRYGAARVKIIKKSIADFDADGSTDISIFRPSPTGGEWWWQRSSDNVVPASTFGLASDVIAPGDFTGDGKLDITVWRPSNGFWYVLRSEDSSFFAFPFGTTGDVPITADYDGDGMADPAVFRASAGRWFIRRSSDNQVQTIQFGLPGDAPVVADYDGDGKADIAIKRNGPNGAEWWINRSTQGVIAFVFGASNDLAVHGDYTGDGKADVALFRASTGGWFILRSEDLSFYGFPFGQEGDMPVPGDYDGDGRVDPAVFRPSANTWFIDGSTSGMRIQNFGLPGDKPIPNALVR
ncbi:MAG TPA: hypothetical protein DEP46_16125 [Blastocatellia bacterium]|nr:hypothetical protein [Blastocatellia bacterium]